MGRSRGAFVFETYAISKAIAAKKRRSSPPPSVVVSNYFTPNPAVYDEIPAGSFELRKLNFHVPLTSGLVLRLKM